MNNEINIMGKREKLLNFALKVPMITILFLILIKYIVFYKTNSLIIFSSFADSFLDLFSSCVTFIALKFSIKEKTEKYQYGFYAMVDVSTFIVAFFILTTSCVIYYKGFLNIINKNILTYSKLSVYVMIVSVLFSLSVSLFLKIIYKKTHSVLVKNEITHFFSDIFTNVGIIISLIITKFYNNYLIDPFIAIMLATVSALPAFEMIKTAFDNIMSKEVSEDIKSKIIEIATRDNRIKGYHRFKTRKSGERIFIQLDIELPSGLDFKEAHGIIDNIEKSVMLEIENSEILIHADPR